MASNKVRSNLPNQATVTAVIIKGHLERRLMTIREAWEYAVTGPWATRINRD